MAWYKNGQITVQSGSRTVLGAGTAWLTQVLPGEGLDVLDGRLQEIAEVISNTELLLVDVYAGAAAVGVAYQVIPSASMTKELTRRVNALIATHEQMTTAVGNAYESTLENAAKVAADTEQVEGGVQAAAASAKSAAEAQTAARADSDAAMGYRNEARAASGAARSDAEGAGQSRTDARQALLQAEAARDAAGAFAQSVNPSVMLDRSNHTGVQPIASVAGLQDALRTTVQQTSAEGAALLPEGADGQRPADGSIPAGHLVIRGSTQAPADYKPEFWDRAAAVWKAFADRTWVGQQIDTAVQEVKNWVDQQIGFTIIYPSGTEAVPGQITANTRYVIPNPFPGKKVQPKLQVKTVNTDWGDPGWIWASAANTQGARVEQYGADIVVTTGNLYVATSSGQTGAPWPAAAVAGGVTTAPFRILVTLVKG